MDYTIVRQKRKTLSARINDSGCLEIRVPIGTRDEQIARFVNRVTPWAKQKLAVFHDRRARYAGLYDGREIMLEGATYPVIQEKGAGFDPVRGLYFAESTVALKHYLKAQAKAYLPQVLDRLAVALGVTVRQCRISSARKRWGSCTAKGTVLLNFRLLCLPLALREYVMVHELCHLRHLNHSDAFWAEVARFCPDYKTLRSKLQSYAFLMNVYE